jgi:hypothetical protein
LMSFPSGESGKRVLHHRNALSDREQRLDLRVIENKYLHS